jgi:Restriction alleviation protein Lar
LKTLFCPFCGSVNQEIYDLYYDGSHVLVYCECGAQAGVAKDEENASALWNTRIPPVPQESYQLPCPFCGGSEQEEYQQGQDFWLWCLCGAQGSHAKDREGAITAWNTCISQALEKK